MCTKYGVIVFCGDGVLLASEQKLIAICSSASTGGGGGPSHIHQILLIQGHYMVIDPLGIHARLTCEVTLLM
jgi:hypothetical protein